MKYVAAIFIIFSLVSLVNAAQINGRVVLGDEPLPGMIVRAYSDLDPSKAPLAASTATQADGLFKLEVPVGFVALYAESLDGRYFAFCGRNPLRAHQEPIWAGLQAIEIAAATSEPYDDEYSAALEGVVRFDGKPVADAYVSLYLDVAEDLKGQGYRLSAPTAKDGSFAFDGLPESDYFLVARKRQNQGRVGPLLEGDMLGVYAGNPLRLRAGFSLQVGLPMVVRQQSEQSTGLPDRPGLNTLSGRILDLQGNPLAGLHVFAYTNPVIGHQRPAALSQDSAADGRFSLSLRAPGVYYIGARQAYGDSPAPGELFGLYEGRADHGLNIVPGINPPIVIQVSPINLD